MTDLSSRTQLAILLTAKWAANGSTPLTSTEFLELRRWLGASADAASDLISGERTLEGCPIEASRVESLLQRGLGVFQSIDRWMQVGLWVRSWADADYPSRFKQLRHRAPVLLFGYGNPEAFSARAIAIVGSRNASEERLAKAAEIGRACARAGVTVVSGGARGVDSVAMISGMAGGGTVVGVLADSLLKESGKKVYRDAIQDNRLCLMSEVSPEAQFNVGNAMARNRLAYACGDAALVIECDQGRGGTWQGAMEARREGKAVYVLRGARAERELAELGAIVIDIEFALQPEKLADGARPDAVAPNDSALHAWARELVGSGPLEVEALAKRLQTEADSIAAQLIYLLRMDGSIPSPGELPVQPAMTLGGPSESPTQKRRSRNVSAKAVTLFDSVEQDMQT